jgi:hypothetical protein
MQERKTLATLDAKYPEVWQKLEIYAEQQMPAYLELMAELVQANPPEVLFYLILKNYYTFGTSDADDISDDFYTEIKGILPDEYHELSVIVVGYFAIKYLGNASDSDAFESLQTIYNFSLEDAV